MRNLPSEQPLPVALPDVINLCIELYREWIICMDIAAQESSIRLHSSSRVVISVLWRSLRSLDLLTWGVTSKLPPPAMGQCEVVERVLATCVLYDDAKNRYDHYDAVHSIESWIRLETRPNDMNPSLNTSFKDLLSVTWHEALLKTNASP